MMNIDAHQLLTLARNVEGISLAGGKERLSARDALLPLVMCVSWASLVRARSGLRTEAVRMEESGGGSER